MMYSNDYLKNEKQLVIKTCSLSILIIIMQSKNRIRVQVTLANSFPTSSKYLKNDKLLSALLLTEIFASLNSYCAFILFYFILFFPFVRFFFSDFAF